MGINSLNQFARGTKINSDAVNQNFETLRESNNSLDSDITNIDNTITSIQDNYLKNDGSNTSINLQSYYSSTITGATNASPIVITSVNHNRTTGDQVYINGVGGNTTANNTVSNPVWTITKIDANSFSLNGSTGNGAYTSGGTVNLAPQADNNIVTKNYISTFLKSFTGTIIPFTATSVTNLIAIPAQGQTVLRASYPTLWAYAQASGNIVDDATWTNVANGLTYTGMYSTGNGTDNFRVPDLRGVDLRGYDALRALDKTNQTGNTHSNATIDNLQDTSIMYVGMPISGTGIPANTTVASIVSATSITISHNATATTTGVALTFTGRKFGSYQADQLQDHTHGLKTLFDEGGLAIANMSGGSPYYYGSTENPNTGNHGPETRSKNVAYLFGIIHGEF